MVLFRLTNNWMIFEQTVLKKSGLKVCCLINDICFIVSTQVHALVPSPGILEHCDVCLLWTNKESHDDSAAILGGTILNGSFRDDKTKTDIKDNLISITSCELYHYELGNVSCMMVGEDHFQYGFILEVNWDVKGQRLWLLILEKTVAFCCRASHSIRKCMTWSCGRGQVQFGTINTFQARQHIFLIELAYCIFFSSL